jgi:hypothetical protein
MLVGLVELGPRLLSSRLPALGSIAWRPRARRAREELAGELTDILVCLAARPQTKVRSRLRLAMSSAAMMR